MLCQRHVRNTASSRPGPPPIIAPAASPKGSAGRCSGEVCRARWHPRGHGGVIGQFELSERYSLIVAAHGRTLQSAPAVARRERPCRRAAEQRDEVAALHCSMPPVLPTERIAQHCRAAGFQSGLCLLRVKPRHCSDVRCTTAPPKAEVHRAVSLYRKHARGGHPG